MIIFTFSMTSLRVLCLHGYRQNGTMFREKTGSLRKLLKKHVAEFVYIDAPHLILNDASNEQEARENERGIFSLTLSLIRSAASLLSQVGGFRLPNKLTTRWRRRRVIEVSMSRSIFC